ncbi:hypothetical protein ONZ51_g11789 [Trametes cubensis]|uniref:SUN domain-containing protein n=1 Tax=Trametes cubensis TaxID=1111947 RepID=A0AAD7THI1_9APHY|nr:hypothetical protein ONZ51_g11789 [Trametes cubensis]
MFEAFLYQARYSSVSKDGKLIAISNVISGFDVYSLESDDALCTVGHTVTEYRKIPIVLIHEAAALVGGNLQGDVHLWDVSSGRKLHSLVHAEGDQILAIAAYYDTERDVFLIATGILRGTSDTSVVVWKAEELDNALDVVDANGRSQLAKYTTSSAATAQLKEEQPCIRPKVESGLRAPSIKAPSMSRNTVFHIEPLVRPHRDADTKKTISPASHSRSTRSVPPSSMPIGSASNYNGFSDNVPSTDTSRSSSSRLAASPSESVSSQSTNVESELPYRKRELKPHTAWFGSEGSHSISAPPILYNQQDVRVGDVFCHKTPTSIQLWLREATERGPYWRAPLSMSGGNSPFDPSRFVYEESPKRVPAGGKTVRFKDGEPSFSEQVLRTHHIPSKRHQVALRAPRMRLEISNNLLVTGSLLILALVLLYVPLPSLDRPIADAVAPTYVFAGHRFFSAWWNIRRNTAQNSPVPPKPSCTLPPENVHDIATDAAFLARWGPVLSPDYALRANGGRIVPSLTSPRSRSAPSTTIFDPEIVIDEEISVGRCWAIAVGGQLGLSTSVLIHPRNVTIDHIPRHIALDIGRAPRHMILWGVVDGHSNLQRFRTLLKNDPEAGALLELGTDGRTSPPLSGSHAFIALTTFEYDVSIDSPSQAFPVSKYISMSNMDFGIFVLEVIDNWGATDTCLYRKTQHFLQGAIICAMPPSTTPSGTALDSEHSHSTPPAGTAPATASNVTLTTDPQAPSTPSTPGSVVQSGEVSDAVAKDPPPLPPPPVAGAKRPLLAPGAHALENGKLPKLHANQNVKPLELNYPGRTRMLSRSVAALPKKKPSSTANPLACVSSSGGEHLQRNSTRQPAPLQFAVREAAPHHNPPSHESHQMDGMALQTHSVPPVPPSVQSAYREPSYVPGYAYQRPETYQHYVQPLQPQHHAQTHPQPLPHYGQVHPPQPQAYAQSYAQLPPQQPQSYAQFPSQQPQAYAQLPPQQFQPYVQPQSQQSQPFPHPQPQQPGSSQQDVSRMIPQNAEEARMVWDCLTPLQREALLRLHLQQAGVTNPPLQGPEACGSASMIVDDDWVSDVDHGRHSEPIDKGKSKACLGSTYADPCYVGGG